MNIRPSSTLERLRLATGTIEQAGAPGRNELDETQELNYRRIAQAIVKSGFQGFVAHEFNPKRDPLTSLKQAALLMDV